MGKRAAFKIVKKYLYFLKTEKNMDIEKAYLFGSYVKGNFNADSDIDIAIIMKNLTDSFVMQVELMKLSGDFDTRIEPHPFDERDFNSDHPLAYEILKTGVKIM